jgi:hypothetical protein
MLQQYKLRLDSQQLFHMHLQDNVRKVNPLIFWQHSLKIMRIENDFIDNI